MSDGYRDPLAPNSSAETHNPFAAPADLSEVATSSAEELATLSSRFTGAFVDGLLMIPAVAGAGYLVFQAAMQGMFGTDELTGELIGGAVGAVIGTLWYVLINGYFLKNRGQTLGKMAARTRIVDAETGEIPQLSRVVFRRWIPVQLLTLVPIIGGILSLINVLLIFRASRKCLHDDFAGTKVIVAK